MIWKCPANLLSVEEMSEAKLGEPWTWEVFRNTLTYYDQDKVKHEVEVDQDYEIDYKRHGDVEMDDGANWGVDSDEEEPTE
jgi:hypothetical protein